MQVQVLPPQRPGHVEVAKPAAAADLGGPRCGWFDSTYELSSGLVITEELDLSLLMLWASSLSLQ